MTSYLVIGAGLFGATVAHELRKAGRPVVVVEKKSHLAGMAYTEKWGNVPVHKYGAHIFRTDDKFIWEYVNKFGEFKPYVHSPIAVYSSDAGSEVYNLPFNMNTFSKLWGIITPAAAKMVIDSQRVPCENPQNLEEYALSVVGKDIYNKLIKGYTEKQWGVLCTELPVSVMKRIPIRFTYDNNYSANKPYQGIPINGYTAVIEALLDGVFVIRNTDGIELMKCVDDDCIVIYTGSVDDIFEYDEGYLGYRSLKFEECKLPDTDNYQGVSVVNYTSSLVPYTRIIEHKHFLGNECDGTIITYEYPMKYTPGMERYYPLSDGYNIALYNRYVARLKYHYPNIILGGRLGSYQYTDMEDTIKAALKLSHDLLYVA